MNSWILKNLVPPLLAKALTRGARRREQLGRFRACYGVFLGPGDLCFDVGANFGNRTRCFRALGCRVVAVEPQARCLRRLRREFGRDREVAIVAAALGATAGQATLRTSAVHVLSTLSDRFIETTRGSGRFAAVEWAGREEVAMTTLDALIGVHGMPSFLKIDVEGFEPEVLAGLSQPVPALSFEWTPELPGSAAACLERLSALGEYEFNYSWEESMRMARAQWLTAGAVTRVVEEFAGENRMIGDIYARLRGAGHQGS
jgi:FkbM family methyltransferase